MCQRSSVLPKAEGEGLYLRPIPEFFYMDQQRVVNNLLIFVKVSELWSLFSKAALVTSTQVANWI